MMRILFLAVSTLFLCSCNGGGAGAEQFDGAGFIIEKIPGTSCQRVVKTAADGALQEEGMLRGGLREGAWVVYHSGGVYPEKIINYAEGMYNGPYMEFNERGQLSLRATYQNNILNGPWGKYRSGRPEAEANYKNGKLDGVYKEFNDSDGKLLKEVGYKNGLQHGMLRFYNDKGEVAVEYEYRNGEKVGGGIVEGQGEENAE